MSISKNCKSLAATRGFWNRVVVQLVGQCVVVRIGGRNRVAHGVAHGRALGHAPGVRVILEVGGGVRARGHRGPHRVHGFRIRLLGVALRIRIFNMDPQVAAFICRYGGIGRSVLICYLVPMGTHADHGAVSLGDVPRPRGVGGVAVRVGQGGAYRDGNLGLQPLQCQLSGIIHVSDNHREVDVSPLGGKGGVCPGPHLGGAHRYLVVVVASVERRLTRVIPHRRHHSNRESLALGPSGSRSRVTP